MRHTMIIARRVIRQVLRDRRLLALSIAAPLVVIYLLKLFFDTMPAGFHVARYAIPISAFLVHFFSFLLCAIVLVQERTGGTLERMFINGFSRLSIVSGYVLGYLGLASLQAAIVLVEVIALFGLSYTPAVLVWLFVVVWMLAIASVLLGIFISTFARNQGQVFPFIPLIALPSVFLSGLIADANALPTWAQVLGRLFPLYYANRVLQALIGPAGSPRDEWGALLALTSYSVIVLLLAARTLPDTE